jgi:hypothetical protein
MVFQTIMHVEATIYDNFQCSGGFPTTTNMVLTSTQFQKVYFWHLHVLQSEGPKLTHILLFTGSNSKNFAKHLVSRSHKFCKVGKPL